jgi:NAD(P)-dependent dehydrogenase (short-subunit alcohol dehydrogenase family)
MIDENERGVFGGQRFTGAILFLTSEDAAFITGRAIVVDGGQYRIG